MDKYLHKASKIKVTKDGRTNCLKISIKYTKFATFEIIVAYIQKNIFLRFFGTDFVFKI